MHLLMRTTHCHEEGLQRTGAERPQSVTSVVPALRTHRHRQTDTHTPMSCLGMAVLVPNKARRVPCCTTVHHHSTQPIHYFHFCFNSNNTTGVQAAHKAPVKMVQNISYREKPGSKFTLRFLVWEQFYFSAAGF